MPGARVTDARKAMLLVMRQVYLKGSGFNDLMEAFIALCGVAVFLNRWAVLKLPEACVAGKKPGWSSRFISDRRKVKD